MDEMKAPPRLWHRFFRWFCHPDLLPGVEGDLMELYIERLKESGKRKADRRFIIDVLLLFRLGIIRPVEGSYHLNSYGMLKNYLKVGVRNILKYKAFSFINVFGLAAAMSVCMLVIVMLVDQRSYDRFHIEKDRIYRILSDDRTSPFPYASSPVPLSNSLKTDYPIVEEAVRMIKGVGGDATYKGKTVEMRGFFSDPSFFTVFSFELEKGNPRNALVSPNSMVISSELASRLFRDEDPMGKTIEFVDRGLHYLGGYRNEPPPTPWGSYVITGVIAKNGKKSHLKFDVLVSSASMPLLSKEKKINDLTENWQNFYECFTYVLLVPGKNEEDLAAALDNVAKRNYSELEFFEDFKLTGQKLTEITPGIFTANPTRFSIPLAGYYALSFLALIILVSACLNYSNLSIARATTRSKEIGIRKVTGAGRENLVFQFLCESILTALLAVVIASVLLLFMAQALMGLWINQHLHFDLYSAPSMYLIFIGFGLLIGCIAGLYPALHLSGYHPIKALRNSDGMRSGKLGMRKVLSVLQFTTSLLFITTSILIFNQFRHFLKFDYGFKTKNIVNIPLQGNDYRKVLGELSSVPGVGAISACDIIPATGISNGTRFRSMGDEVEYKYFGAFQTDENFVGNFGLELIAGRNLPTAHTTSKRFVLLNEAGAKELGYHQPSEIIGQLFEEEGTNEAVEVIGVVKNFRFRLLIEQDEIGPMVLRNRPHFNFANVEIVSGDLNATLARLEEKWKSTDPTHTFKYEFFDEQLATTHRAIFDVVSILGFITFLAVVIACLGLLGMATYSTERRTKEVGIRKALGAAESSIAILLSREFLGMLLIAIGIAAPLSYFLNNLWLQNLPNRVEFGFGTVAMASGMLLVLGLVTIGSQTLRASRRNPVDALKSE